MFRLDQKQDARVLLVVMQPLQFKNVPIFLQSLTNHHPLTFLVFLKNWGQLFFSTSDRECEVQRQGPARGGKPSHLHSSKNQQRRRKLQKTTLLCQLQFLSFGFPRIRIYHRKKGPSGYANFAYGKSASPINMRKFVQRLFREQGGGVKHSKERSKNHLEAHGIARHDSAHTREYSLFQS